MDLIPPDENPDLMEVDVREDGILWMINRTVFHPRGVALAYNETTRKFFLMGDTKEIWWMDPVSIPEQKLFEKFNDMLARKREHAETYQQEAANAGLD